MNHRPRKKGVTALEAMRVVKRVASSLATAADDVLKALESRPRPVVEIGFAYKTVDKSIVYVARRVTACKCDLCTGRAVLAGFFAGMAMLRKADEPGQGEAVPATTDEDGKVTLPDHDAKDDENPEYVCVVLKGGHGVKDNSGEEPGDPYVVDKQGMPVGLDPNDNAVHGVEVGLAGLSLQERLRIRLEPETETTAA